MSSTTKLRKLARKLECPVDEDGGYTNDRWTNRDLIPIPPDRRTYKIWSFCIYWFVSGACISAYSTGSSLLAYGLTAQQSMACVVIGAVITGLLSVVSGFPGEIHHIGFTVVSRMSWGMKGSYFPVCLRVFTSVWWFGIQSYWGGQAVNLMLGAMSPSWKHQPNKFSASSNITHQDFLGVVLWYLAYIPLVLVPPERLQRPFVLSSAAFGATLIGLLAWAVPNAGGGGPLFKTVNTASSTPYSMMLGITSILGSWGSGTIGQSDWVRYSERRYYPMLSQLFAAPLMITLCALVGVVVTSASSSILGEIIWSPIELLSAIQDHYNSTPGVRAAVFFAGLGCTCAQLSINVLLNSVSTGMDMAGLWPKYLNIRRGAYLLAAIGIASNPWQILASAATFLSVISGLGVFIAPMTGIMLADYIVLRRCHVKIEDLYNGSPSSIYWFKNGFHWRAIVAFIMGAWPFCPGFIMILIDPTATNAWVKLFNISFLVGLAIGFFVYLGICLVSPIPHQKEGLNYLDDERFCKNVSGEPSTPAVDENESEDKDRDIKGIETNALVREV
ncbi:uncharacterized protein L199_005409 [Kwoniella botswanensis]|uniref:uncharacterized protein n=1 Tax=Kwoniella botswanensis TaxID=1268659 RepID=UPI00315CCEEF